MREICSRCYRHYVHSCPHFLSAPPVYEQFNRWGPPYQEDICFRERLGNDHDVYVKYRSMPNVYTAHSFHMDASTWACNTTPNCGCNWLLNNIKPHEYLQLTTVSSKILICLWVRTSPNEHNKNPVPRGQRWPLNNDNNETNYGNKSIWRWQWRIIRGH